MSQPATVFLLICIAVFANAELYLLSLSVKLLLSAYFMQNTSASNENLVFLAQTAEEFFKFFFDFFPLNSA